jgi:hypothetical protein
MGNSIQLKLPLVKTYFIKLLGYGFVPFVGRLGPDVARTFFPHFHHQLKLPSVKKC